MINISIVGASGYSGMHLAHAVSSRQDVSVACITSRSFAGKKLSEVYPAFKKFSSKKNPISELSFSSYDEELLSSSSDFIFYCLPHGESSTLIPGILKRNKQIKIIDIGADYRFDDLKIYEAFYGKHGSSDELNSKFIYGLSDVFYEDIKKSRLIANPGCYPTGALLPLIPLFLKDVVDLAVPVIIDALSGISGAGRGLKLSNLFCEAENSAMAYNVWSHRHMPEIKEKITSAYLSNYKDERAAAGLPNILFTPHVIPVARGILSTIHLKLKQDISNGDIFNLYSDFYRDSPFISIMDNAGNCNIKNVIYSNNCHIAFEKGGDGFVKIFSAIDNLGKGASLQALQNMNLMSGLAPDFGIGLYSPYP